MTHFASDENGHITDQERTFLQNRFKGFGLFIAAATLVQANGKTFEGQPYAISEDDLPSLREVAQIAQAQGAKAILQIHHGGLKAEFSADIVAPSADEATGARELTAAEIEQLIAAYANAATLAVQAGFDGVERKSGAQRRYRGGEKLSLCRRIGHAQPLGDDFPRKRRTAREKPPRPDAGFLARQCG